MVELDGSHGEGGGQIVRSALALSAITGVPVRITRIRAGRPKPGLRPQHLTGVAAMYEICPAKTVGAEVGSTELTFAPGAPRPGRYGFDVSRIRSSAGSVTLVMQTVLPALALISGPSELTLFGGTHVPWSPPYHYVERCFLPALQRMGVDVSCAIERWGFYPKGGGAVRARISPCGTLRPVTLLERGRLVGVTGISAVANLDMSIARRQADSARRMLEARGVGAEVELVDAPSPGQGTFIALYARYEGATLCFSALGERGKRAEAVGEEAASALVAHMETGACIEERLSDQLVPYMALADGTSEFTVSRVSRHLLTNIWVIGQFLPDAAFVVEGEEGGPGRVRVQGAGVK